MQDYNLILMSTINSNHSWYNYNHTTKIPILQITIKDAYDDILTFDDLPGEVNIK